MTAAARGRRRPLGALAVLGLVWVGTAGTSSASSASAAASSAAAAAHGVSDAAAPRADLSVSIQAEVSVPASTQDPDAKVTLDYLLRNTGPIPIHDVRLVDPLVPDGLVLCDGSAAVRELPPGSAAACSAAIELPPGTYTSRPQAHGWIYVLILAFPVTGAARTAFTVAAPPTATPATSTALVTAAVQSAHATVAERGRLHASACAAVSDAFGPDAARAGPDYARAPPDVGAPATDQIAGRAAAATGPTPAVKRAHAVPAVPAAQVHRLPTHVTVLLLLLPAAVGAAVAGAAALRRR